MNFTSELNSLPVNYLAEKAEIFLGGTDPYTWSDDGGMGFVANVPWGPLRQVLRRDDIYFGSTRMVQLLCGHYNPSLDFSISGDWTPAEGRPFHATSVNHVSLVTWRSASFAAAQRKAQHFKGIVGRASAQLTGDRPGAIHVGYEAVGGNSADGLRHHLNRVQMLNFDARETKLRWVYGNYFTPERVVARNESAAISETTAWYPVGRGRTKQPLPGHMLFINEDGQPGSHFTY